MTFKDEEHKKRVQHQVEKRLREVDDKIQNSSEAPFYQTTNHRLDNSQAPWMPKVILGLQLFGISVAVLVAVKVASVLAGFVFITALTWIAYKLLIENRKS